MTALIFLIFPCSLLIVWGALHSGLASRLAVDQPNARSLHVIPVPRVGGFLTLPIALLGAIIFGNVYPVLVAMAAFLCLMSFIDDRVGLPVGVRLLLHLAVSGLAVTIHGVDGFIFVILLTLAMAWMINLFNFMDGADGLAGGMAVIGFGSYAVAAWLSGSQDIAILSLCIVAAMCGFLLFNFSPARIFMGDAGSTTLGFLAAALGVLGWQQEAWPAWFPVLVFSPFVVDASVTLLQRALRGERIWEAHREHSYQKLIRMGWSHRRLALCEYLLMSVCAVVAVLLRQEALSIVTPALLLIALSYGVMIYHIGAKWRAHQISSGQ